MSSPRRIEREFGVPFAGKILDPAHWTQTALKKFPELGPLDWQSLFGRSARIVLDLGCGNGRYSIHSAVTRPDHDHLGIDTLPVVIRYARKRGNQRGLSNLRFAVGDALQLLERHIPPRSVHEIHCYHPQPYAEFSQIHRRLIQPRFLALVHRALADQGIFVIQSDNYHYWQDIQQMVVPFFHWHERIGPWPDATRGRTRREIIAIKRKFRIYRGWGIRRDVHHREVNAASGATEECPRADA